MKKKTGRILLIAAVLFACWLQFPVGMHVKKSIPGVKATCVEAGLTEGKECILCGKMLVTQQEIPATGLHIYSDDFDKTCNNCSYIREVSSSFEFVNYRVVLRDEDENHKNWRVVVYKLGDETVEDPSDEEALQAIDDAAKTHWGIEEINRILLTEPGDYVLLLKYNIGENVAIRVPLEITVTDDPKLIVDGDNRVRMIDSNAENKNHTLTVYDLGAETVSDIEDEDEVKEAAINTQTYTGIDTINELVITKGGNYVLYLRYETADGAQQTMTLSASLTNSRPSLTVNEENGLVVTCEDESVINFRAFVYYLGEQTVTDIYDEEALETLVGEPKAYWGLKQIKKAALSEPGTYVIHLHYNVGTGNKETVALKVTIPEAPGAETEDPTRETQSPTNENNDLPS